jgi:hypothetical protein
MPGARPSSAAELRAVADELLAVDFDAVIDREGRAS